MAADSTVVAPDAEVQVEQRQAVVTAEPAAPEEVVISQPPVATGAPVALAYPEIPSPAGLTPGAPLGSDPISDQKLVVGQELRTGGAGIRLR